MDYSNVNKNVIKIIDALAEGRAYLNEFYSQ